MKRLLWISVFSGLAIMVAGSLAAAQQIAACGCYCGKVLRPPCGDNACKQACGWTGGRPAGAVDCGGGHWCPGGETCASGHMCIRAGYADCGDGLMCPPGQKCIAGGKCITNTDIDCGDGHWCRAGYTCSSGGLCVPPGKVDCGSYTCPAGETCMPGKKCLKAGYTYCGGERSCPPGERCAADGSGCVPGGAVDCGSGHWCPAGATCASGGNCLREGYVDCGNGKTSPVGVGCESADRQSIAAQQQKVGEENAKRDKEEFDSTKAQLLRDLNNDVTPGSANTSGAPLTPGPLRNIPAKVLENRQPDVAEVDRKIKQAQEALYRLIHSNQQSDDQRMEWTADSLDASEDAEKLSLNLVLDLIGAHVDYLADVNKEERAEVLDQLLSRSEAQSQGKSLHNIYGMMVDRKEELERIHSEVDLIGKENDLRGKLDDLEEANDSEFTREDMFDIVMNIKDAVGVLAHKEFPAAVNLAGPAKDLLDSAYVIWKQAASMSRLSQIQGVQEQNLKAAASLRQYILKLEKQKQKAKTGAAGQVSAKPM